MNRYKIAFFVSVAVIVVLTGLLWVRLRPAQARPAPAEAQDSVAAPATAANTPAPETPLVPVQLTPERMQAIGVKLAKAEMQTLTDEIRASGNVEINDRAVSYVQTRFPGWIREVYANASYQYIRQGQPLFTIYSPDLVTTEQEYLLARKNAEAVQSPTGPLHAADAGCRS